MSTIHISAQESKVNIVNTIFNLEIATNDLIIKKVGVDGFHNLNEEIKSNSENSIQILNNYLGAEISTLVQQNLIQIASAANSLKEICPNDDDLKIVFSEENFPAIDQCLLDCGVSAALGYSGCSGFVHPAAIGACALAVLYLHYRCNANCNSALGVGSGSGGSSGTIGGGLPGGGWTGGNNQPK